MWKVLKIIKKGDYNYALVPDHPNSTKNGYVLHHRIVVENHINRLLSPDEVVHHVNGNKKDNRIENLEVKSKKQHARDHASENGSAWCVLKCPKCGVIFEKPKNQTHLYKGGMATFCSRSCAGKFNSLKRLHGATLEMQEAISGNIVSEFRKYLHDNPEET